VIPRSDQKKTVDDRVRPRKGFEKEVVGVHMPQVSAENQNAGVT